MIHHCFIIQLIFHKEEHYMNSGHRLGNILYKENSVRNFNILLNNYVCIFVDLFVIDLT